MFETLFQQPKVIARHQRAPFAEERRRYLVHCAEQGYSHATLLFKARELLWVAYKLGRYPHLRLTTDQVEAVAQGWEEHRRYCGQALNEYWTHRRCIEVARPWLRFLGCLHEPTFNRNTQLPKALCSTFPNRLPQKPLSSPFSFLYTFSQELAQSNPRNRETTKLPRIRCQRHITNWPL